ncbi:DUF5979 domain-containing protein [Microbacterium trichothecenolyticum]|uniref:T surface-antigen of pili n=1 Tax=Microbacterium trichothecenolyticum TaxID=69370 RepID=A0A0M2H8F0_MICTR|nr:DUF5979 domain-containing protein [Microbacterium trichothecenolyticum]KJL40375.1 T surface-antigen of pili [Microbacterium trichothecenolyticum]
MRSRIAASVTILAIAAATLIAPAASAAPILPDPAPVAITAVATLDKTASATEVAPGETFTYTLTVGCSAITDLGCRGAVLSDVVPAPFVVVEAVVGGGANTAAEPVIDGNSVTVTWTTPLGDGTVGILDNTTGIVEITAQLPADASYDVSGTPVINQATIEGANFADEDAVAPVTPVVPLELATTASKTFTPTEAIATPGAAVSAALGGTNTSNATVESLSIQDPVDPDASPNPFDSLAFASFGTVTPPTGADPVLTTYEVYVDGAWVEAPGGTLPAGVAPDEVKGTRVTFNGAIPAGASGSVALNLTVPDAATSEPDGTTVANDVLSTVAIGDETATGDAAASFTLRQNTVTVAAGKSFDPDLVIAGESTTVTIGGRNTSTIPIDQLTITEPSTGSFPAEYRFGGFAGPVAWPAGATSGEVVYTLAGGGTVTVPFANNTVPALPDGVDPADVTSFQLVFTGDIVPGGETEVPFAVDTDPDLTGLPITVPNVVGVEGENAGVTGTADATDELYIYDEVIEPYISKQIRPTPILAVPGEVVTVTLNGGLTERPSPPDNPTGTTGRAQQVVIQDPEDPVEGDAWWNAFDLTAIAQTPVPGDSTLTIEYYDTTTGTWETLAGPIAGPTIYSQQVPSDISDVAGGVRFVYDYTGDAGGFAPGTDFAPSFTSSLREDGRYTEEPPFSDDESTFVPNCAQTDASSANPSVPDGQAVLPPDDCPVLELVPPDPGNADLIDKSFGTSSSGGIKTVIARSGDTIPSTLRWSTGGYSNLERVEITDVAAPETTALTDSLYNAFDLTRINAITTVTDPLIAYDAVQAVQLYNGTAWVTAANNPCTPLCIGQFPGMNLTTAERASTVAVRLTFVESPDRAAASAGDPTAPPVGSGVARSFANDRPVTLVWQVRDTRRSDGTPVLGDQLYNVTTDGVVRNTANATGFPEDGSEPLSADDQDDVSIIDVPLTTTTDKNWQGGPLAVPNDPDVLPSQYPLSRIAVTTRNTTPAKVDMLQITDTAPGSVTDRRQDPFQAFAFNNFVRIDLPVGATDTVVTLSCFGGAPLELTRAEALALTPNTMPCEVSGVQVTYTGRIAANAAGVVEFDLRLRPFWRGTTERVSVADSPISNTAEGVIADVDPFTTCPPPERARWACDDASAAIALEEPTFSVSAGKTIAPAQQKENDFSPVTVTLTGQPGGSARAYTMLMTDDDPTFWNAMDFVGPDPDWQLPPPIGKVQVCYLDGGDFTDANVVAGDVGGTWTCMPRLGDLSVAAAKTFLENAPSTLHGLSFQFWSDVELGWTNPVNPIINVPFFVERRADLRTGEPTPTTRSDQVPAPGEQDAGVFFDTVTVEGISAQIGLGERLTDDETAEAEYRNLHLEASVNVVKSPTGDVRPGVEIPFTLAYTNTGERALTDVVFTDELPLTAGGQPQLIFNPDRDPSVPPWSFSLTGAAPTPPNGDPLPTDPDDVEVDDLGTSIVFTMPEGSVLEPGQTYTITLRMMLRPGLTPNDSVTNTATIDVAEPLDECVPSYDEATGLCADTATVRPLAVPALSTVKFVRADNPPNLPDVPNVRSDDANFECDGAADADGFYRYPCVPLTLPGDTETWRLRITNAGTVPISQLVSIDNLPTPGDQGLIVVIPRGSQWQPTYADSLELIVDPTTPANAQISTFYSTSSLPCTADLNPVGTPCAIGAWLPLDDTVDPATVRSIKVAVDFPGDEKFEPGDSLTLQFKTRTSPDRQVVKDQPTAYNTISTGGAALSGDATVLVPATEGRRVGVAYPTGSIALEKIVSGPAAEFAPDSFPVQLVCTIDGQPIGGLPEVELVPGADPTVIDGLPLGAECTATEDQWGQTQTDIGTATVTLDTEEIGLVTIENIYDVASLRISKAVDTDAVDSGGDPIPYGPFTFEVTCELNGQPAYADGYGPDVPMIEEITPEQAWALDGLPVNATCTVEETDALGAEGTTMQVDSEEPVEGTSVDVTIQDETEVQVLATNSFGVGSFRIEKSRTGAAAEDFGAGPFEFAAVCTLDTGSGTPRIVWAGFLTLDEGNGYEAQVDDVAAGASCTVRETEDGGATSVEITPSQFTIESGGTQVVGAVNTFDAGSLTVTKVIDGEGAELWGGGQFTVVLDCLDGAGESVMIPGGAEQVLSEENDYTYTYEPLLIGLECTLTETETGGAHATTITDAEGEPVETVEIVEGETDVTVTNTFDVGQIEVVKTVSGGDASLHRTDSFEVTASCTWNGSGIEVPGGAVRALTTGAPVIFEDLPVGAECTLRETSNGGADAVTYTPADPDGADRAVVTVGGEDAASVAIDNRFDSPLPATGADGARMAGLGAIGALAILAGVFAMVVMRRRLRV